MRTHQRLLMSLLAALLSVGVVAGSAVANAASAARRHSDHRAPSRRRHKSNPGGARGSGSGSLPEQAMESALQIKASKVNGDLRFGVERTDIHNVTLNGTPITPAFQINGEVDFQPLGGQQAFMNGDLAFKPSELDRAIRAIIANGLTFQAEHQHMYDFQPMVWFIHFRGRGNAVKLAHEVHNVIKATSTPLPQPPPSNPKTPLDVMRLKSILHGYDAEVSDNGVVTVYVARRNPVYIDGVRVNPATNISTNVSFEPLNSSGTQAAVIPDFGMVAGEVNRVVGTMQAQGWDIGCLYNQETAETPQLYFSHEFKTGNPYQLAQEVRTGLNRTNSR